MTKETECIGCGKPTPDNERVGDGLCEACAKPDGIFYRCVNCNKVIRLGNHCTVCAKPEATG